MKNECPKKSAYITCQMISIFVQIFGFTNWFISYSAAIKRYFVRVPDVLHAAGGFCHLLQFLKYWRIFCSTITIFKKNVLYIPAFSRVCNCIKLKVYERHESIHKRIWFNKDMGSNKYAIYEVIFIWIGNENIIAFLCFAISCAQNL